MSGTDKLSEKLCGIDLCWFPYPNPCILLENHGGACSFESSSRLEKETPDLSGWIDLSGSLVRASEIIAIRPEMMPIYKDTLREWICVSLRGDDRKFYYSGTRDELVKAIKDSEG